MGKNLNKGVRKAVEIAGGTYQALAEKLNCSPEAVRKMQWVNCTAERAVEIEAATGVPREEIRPDIFLKGDQQPDADLEPPLATPKQMREETTKRAPRAQPARREQFDDNDGQIIEPVPSSIDNIDPEKPAPQFTDDHRAEVERRIKQSPNVDIARPGRLVRVNAEQPKTKTGGRHEQR